jgi:hypothetical protein
MVVGACVVGIRSTGFSSLSFFIAGAIQRSYRGSLLNVIACGNGKDVLA